MVTLLMVTLVTLHMITLPILPFRARRGDGQGGGAEEGDGEVEGNECGGEGRVEGEGQGGRQNQPEVKARLGWPAKSEAPLLSYPHVSKPVCIQFH